MIELTDIKKENEQNNIIKEEKKESKPSSFHKSDKQKEGNKKNEVPKNKINIYLSVNDINNMISMQNEQNKPKFLFFCIFILFSLLFTNMNFIFFLGYLRPTFETNRYYCYNSLTKHYKKCLTDSFCYCNHNYCTSFCYEKDFSKCHDIFESQTKELYKNKLISLPNYMRSIKFESEIIYPLEEEENVSVFQKINYYYCFIDRYSIGFIADFILGNILGYYIFGLISDLFGRKKCIIILSIITLMANGGIMIIANYPLYEHKNILITLWFILIFLLGISLEPLESAIYVYFLEMFPFKVLIKPFNSLIFIRYFISIAFLCFFNNYIKNLVYIFYFYEAYLVPFNLILIFLFGDTPRFYSERQDINNKLKSFFIKDYNNISFKENENDENYTKNYQPQSDRLEENQRNSKIKTINYSYLYGKFRANININKNYYIILFSNLVLNYLFYTILLECICFFLNPYNDFSISTFLGIFIPSFIFYAALLIIFYITFEIFSLNIIISVLLFFLFIFGIFFDVNELKPDSFRRKIFYPDLFKKNIHLLSGSLFFIVYIMSIYEMMLIFLSPTLYRSYFFFCQKGIASVSLIFAFISVFVFDCPMLFISIIAIFSSILFLTLRVKWEKISLKEEINRKLKNL